MAIVKKSAMVCLPHIRGTFEKAVHTFGCNSPVSITIGGEQDQKLCVFYQMQLRQETDGRDKVFS